jgi:hypothetical protein
MIEIDLTDRMFSAFGYVPSGYPDRVAIQAGMAMGVAAAAGLGAGTGRANIATLKKGIGANVFTNEYRWANLKLENTETGDRFYFANTMMSEHNPCFGCVPMMSFQREKNIVTTPVDGSGSAVVESFGAKPYDITVEGVLIDTDSHLYPGEKIRGLRDLFEANVIWNVLECDLMNDLGIQSLYFYDLQELSVLQDYPDTVKYKLKAKSIKPVEFFI